VRDIREREREREREGEIERGRSPYFWMRDHKQK